VNGFAGGFELALSYDIIVADEVLSWVTSTCAAITPSGGSSQRCLACGSSRGRCTFF
jgi:hypothetical protein